MARVYNFSAGPAVLPEQVLKEAAAEMLDYRGCGMSVMEMSHRSKVFQDIPKEAERDLRELSGGERQRVYLAMALAQGGDTILLDEPTTYLDVSAQFELLELMRTLADQGKSLLLVLHDLAQALQYSDRVAVLSEGGLLAFDSPANLFEQKILDGVFGVTLCRDPEGTYYLRR